MRVQFYASLNPPRWVVYDAKESTVFGTWAFIRAKDSVFFEMSDPKDLEELRAHVCPDGESCGVKMDRVDEAWRKVGPFLVALAEAAKGDG